MTVTATEIARNLGVSQMTVSRALTGKGRIAPATRKRILRRAAELGYRPSAAARAMRRGKARVIGVLQSAFGGAGLLSPVMQWELERSLGERSYRLMLGQFSDEQLADETALPAMLREWAVDGLIVAHFGGIAARTGELLEALRLPLVWLNVKRDFDTVRPDDEGSARGVTEHLLSLGHRRIGFVDARVSSRYDGPLHYSHADRFEGYAGAMRSAGLTPLPMTAPPLAWAARDARPQIEWARRVLQEDQRPTAVLAYSGEYCAWFSCAAQGLGLRVPHDLSLVGYTSERGSRTDPLCPASLVLPWEQIGRAAADMMFEKLDQLEASADEGPAEPIPTRLIPITLDRGDTLA